MQVRILSIKHWVSDDSAALLLGKCPTENAYKDSQNKNFLKKKKNEGKKKKDSHTNVHGSAIRHNPDLETSRVHPLKSR